MVWESKVTKNQQREFKDLYEQGESTVTIGRMFNVTDVTVRAHLISQGVKIRNKVEASKIAKIKGRMKIPTPKQYEIPKSSKHLTKEKSYILGVLCGDGYINCIRNDYQISLQSIDKEFVDEFSKCIYKTYKINPKESFIKVKNPRWNDKYSSRICSKKMFKDLQRYNKSFKTFEWKVPRQILNGSKSIKAKFLQGFFDSEGCVSYKGKKIVGASSNSDGVDGIVILLKNLGIKSKVYDYKNRKLKGIFIQDRRSIELFKNLIGFVIINKKENLKKLVNDYKRYYIPREEIKKQLKTMINYRKKGFSYGKIGKKLNIPARTVWTHLNKINGGLK